MVERAEELVSVMCFPQRAFGCHKQFFFRYPSYSSSKPPQAGFSICKSNLLFVLWFCCQCSSILFPAPLISAYCSPPHTYTLPYMPSAWLITTTNPKIPVFHIISADIINLTQIVIRIEICRMITRNWPLCYHVFLKHLVINVMKYHWQITVCLGGQPAKQPVDTGDLSISNHCFIQLPSPSPAGLGSNFILFTVPHRRSLNMSAVIMCQRCCQSRKSIQKYFNRLICSYSRRLLCYREISSYDLFLITLITKTKSCLD